LKKKENQKKKIKKRKKETDADIAALHSVVTAWRGVA